MGLEKEDELLYRVILDAENNAIIIGKNGAMLKKVSTYARQDMEKFFDCHINLQCWVKVKEGWRDREGLIHNFGLDNE